MKAEFTATERSEPATARRQRFQALLDLHSARLQVFQSAGRQGSGQSTKSQRTTGFTATESGRTSPSASPTVVPFRIPTALQVGGVTWRGGKSSKYR